MDPEFSFDGRASRGEFAFAMAILVVLFWPTLIVLLLVTAIVPPLAVAVVFGVPTLFGVLAMMTTVRRLQDIGVSALHILAPVGMMATALVFQDRPVSFACTLLLVLWGIAVLVWPSEPGTNQHGPQPGVKG